MNLVAIPKHIIKEAQRLRTRLGKGSINLIELERFLALVESFSSPSAGKKKYRSRFNEKLDALNNKR